MFPLAKIRFFKDIFIFFLLVLILIFREGCHHFPQSLNPFGLFEKWNRDGWYRKLPYRAAVVYFLPPSYARMMQAVSVRLLY